MGNTLCKFTQTYFPVRPGEKAYCVHIWKVYGQYFMIHVYIHGMEFDIFTLYGCTMYKGIAMVFASFLHTRIFDFCFQFLVTSTFNDFTAQSKLSSIHTMYFLILIQYNTHNSITILPIDMNLGIWTGFRHRL